MDKNKAEELKSYNLNMRDYFAGQALAGMGEYLMKNRDDLDSVAKTCYAIADSFIEQRIK
jgi:hypothetical protein